MKTPCAGRSGFPQPLVRLGFPEGARACSPLTAPSLAAALIMVICVVLTLKVTSLRDASVGWIVTLLLLLVALVIPIVVVWRQPQSNARLNFKVSATPSSSVFAPHPPQSFSAVWATAASARAFCWAVTVQERPAPRDLAPQGAVPSVAVLSGLWRGGVPLGQEQP